MTSSPHRVLGYVLPPGTGRAIPVPFARSTVTMKAEGHQTAGGVTAYESEQEPHSVGPARHYHERLTELFYVLEGELAFLIGEEVHQIRTGAMVVIPPRTVHAFRNASSQPARLLIVVAPGGFEGFFDEAQDLRAPMSDNERWRQINARWDIHIVGPPLTE